MEGEEQASPIRRLSAEGVGSWLLDLGLSGPHASDVVVRHVCHVLPPPHRRLESVTAQEDQRVMRKRVVVDKGRVCGDGCERGERHLVEVIVVAEVDGRDDCLAEGVQPRELRHIRQRLLALVQPHRPLRRLLGRWGLGGRARNQHLDPEGVGAAVKPLHRHPSRAIENLHLDCVRSRLERLAAALLARAVQAVVVDDDVAVDKQVGAVVAVGAEDVGSARDDFEGAVEHDSVVGVGHPGDVLLEVSGVVELDGWHHDLTPDLSQRVQVGGVLRERRHLLLLRVRALVRRLHPQRAIPVEEVGIDGVIASRQHHVHALGHAPVRSSILDNHVRVDPEPRSVIRLRTHLVQPGLDNRQPPAEDGSNVVGWEGRDVLLERSDAVEVDEWDDRRANRLERRHIREQHRRSVGCVHSHLPLGVAGGRRPRRRDTRDRRVGVVGVRSAIVELDIPAPATLEEVGFDHVRTGREVRHVLAVLAVAVQAAVVHDVFAVQPHLGPVVGLGAEPVVAGRLDLDLAVELGRNVVADRVREPALQLVDVVEVDGRNHRLAEVLHVLVAEIRHVSQLVRRRRVVQAHQPLRWLLRVGLLHAIAPQVHSVAVGVRSFVCHEHRERTAALEEVSARLVLAGLHLQALADPAVSVQASVVHFLPPVDPQPRAIVRNGTEGVVTLHVDLEATPELHRQQLVGNIRHEPAQVIQVLELDRRHCDLFSDRGQGRDVRHLRHSLVVLVNVHLPVVGRQRLLVVFGVSTAVRCVQREVRGARKDIDVDLVFARLELDLAALLQRHVHAPVVHNLLAIDLEMRSVLRRRTELVLAVGFDHDLPVDDDCEVALWQLWDAFCNVGAGAEVDVRAVPFADEVHHRRIRHRVRLVVDLVHANEPVRRLFIAEAVIAHQQPCAQRRPAVPRLRVDPDIAGLDRSGEGGSRARQAFRVANKHPPALDIGPLLAIIRDLDGVNRHPLVVVVAALCCDASDCRRLAKVDLHPDIACRCTRGDPRLRRVEAAPAVAVADGVVGPGR
eukprot:3057067-Rhodomonas_salina.14